MDPRRRAQRVSMQQSVVVECRIVGQTSVFLGKVEDASVLGLRISVQRYVPLELGQELAVRFANDAANRALGIAGLTTPSVIRRVFSLSPVAEFGVEVPDLRSRARADLGNLLELYLATPNDSSKAA